MTAMAITFAMPAMAGNKHHSNDKKVVVKVNDKKASHFDHHRGDAYRPDVKVCTFRISRRDSFRTVAAKAERIHGVMDTKWNPRTREITVIYDGKMTSARHIKHAMA